MIVHASTDRSHLKPAVTGLGYTAMAIAPTEPEGSLAASAIVAAVADAGVELADVDGLLLATSQVPSANRVGLDIAGAVGLGDLSFLRQTEVKGASAGALLIEAVDAVASGQARVCVAVFADAPIVRGSSAGSMFTKIGDGRGQRGIERAAGLLGAVPAYALAASRLIHNGEFRREDLASVAIAARSWAVHNPQAVARTPLTLDAYNNSPMIAEPLRRLDCARPVNGAAAFVVTKPHSGQQNPPVTLRGVGEWHPRRSHKPSTEALYSTAPFPVAAATYGRAGIRPADLDIVQLYDPFTVATLHLLAGYGIAGDDDLVELVRAGELEHRGRLAVNTGGGQLSGWYLQGMTPLVEALIQLRGEGGARQVPGAELGLVAMVGGRFDHHMALVLERGA